MERSSVEICICSAVIQKMQTVPFYTIKVRPLTEELNIGRSTFYEYYGSIYDVVEQMEEDLLPCTPISCCIDPPYDSLLEHSITSMFRYLQNAEVFCALTGPNGDPGFSARYTRRVREIRNRHGIGPQKGMYFFRGRCCGGIHRTGTGGIHPHLSARRALPRHGAGGFLCGQP